MNSENPVGQDNLSSLKNRARRALLGRDKHQALEALKQWVALDPADADARKNLNDLLLSVNRLVEAIEKRQGSIEDASDEAQQQALIAELNQKVPYWRGFCDEIPRLEKLTHPSAPRAQEELEDTLTQMLKKGLPAEALARWREASSPMTHQGDLGALLSSLEQIQNAERNGDLARWQGALKGFVDLGSPASSPLLSSAVPYAEASKWRMKAMAIVKRSALLSPADMKVEGARLIEQLSVAEEELRANPSLAADLPLSEQLQKAIHQLKSVSTAEPIAVWKLPLIFMAIIACGAVALMFYNRAPQQVGTGPGRGEPGTGPGRPDPTNKAINPHPLPDDVVVPMPNGWQLVCRKVFIPSAESVRGNLKMPAEGGGGAVWAPFGEGGRRYYLIGKYEVTRGQFAQFLKLATNQDSNLPVTDITIKDAEDFCERFSMWLGSDQFPLKSVSGRPARVRLPTPREWEFAARNGETAFGSPAYDKSWPWDGPVTEREWHAGSSSAGGALKAVGTLKEHPLGMFDMLGNAREMVAETGGGGPAKFWMMGGDFSTSASEMSSGLRIPLPALKPETNAPFRQPELGFRVVFTADADAFQGPNSPGSGQ